jgi:hypothetical protein
LTPIADRFAAAAPSPILTAFTHCHGRKRMEPASLDFLKALLNTPSPSGYERPIQDVVRKYVSDFADEVRTDLHGNVIAVKNPSAKLRVMFAGHCDQIGTSTIKVSSTPKPSAAGIRSNLSGSG